MKKPFTASILLSLIFVIAGFASHLCANRKDVHPKP